MATLKFYQIKEANAEIVRLSAELEAVKQSASTNADKVTFAEAFKADFEKHTAELEKLRTEFSAVSGERDTFAARISELESQHKTAGALAAEIVAAQGVPPVPAGDAVNPVNGNSDSVESVRRALAVEKDPAKKTELALKLREMRGHGKLFN